MSISTMIDDELKFWRGRLEELPETAEARVAIDDAVARISALERVLGQFTPSTAQEAGVLAGVLVDRLHDLEREHCGGPDSNLVLTSLARSLSAYLKDLAPGEKDAARGGTLCGALCAELERAWTAWEALDAELQIVRSRHTAEVSACEARVDACNGQIGALEDAIAATLPKSSLDAAVVLELLDYEMRELDAEALAGHEHENVRMMIRGLAEYTSAEGSVRPKPMLPRAYGRQRASAERPA